LYKTVAKYCRQNKKYKNDMKKDKMKIFKIIGVIFSIIVIILFLDFALGGFIEGWTNPK